MHAYLYTYRYTLIHKQDYIYIQTYTHAYLYTYRYALTYKQVHFEATCSAVAWKGDGNKNKGVTLTIVDTKGERGEWDAIQIFVLTI